MFYCNRDVEGYRKRRKRWQQKEFKHSINIAKQEELHISISRGKLWLTESNYRNFLPTAPSPMFGQKQQEKHADIPISVHLIVLNRNLTFDLLVLMDCVQTI